MHDGHRSLKQEALAPHPMQILQDTVRLGRSRTSGRLVSPLTMPTLCCTQQLRNEWTSKMYLEERVYGAHVAYERRMDRAVLSQVRRLPGVGLPSSHLGVDFVLGRDAKIGFEDYLNCELCACSVAGVLFPALMLHTAPSSVPSVPESRALAPPRTVHETMEAKLGIA